MSEEDSDNAVLDIGSSTSSDERIEELRERIQEQEEIIERQRDALREQEESLADFSDILLDLSARVAGSGGAGVCMKPECPGALLRTRDESGQEVIKCSSCGEVVHEYDD